MEWKLKIQDRWKIEIVFFIAIHRCVNCKYLLTKDKKIIDFNFNAEKILTKSSWIWLWLVAGMVTFRRINWPETNWTFGSRIQVWQTIPERILHFTFWFFGLWSSIWLHIFSWSLGVIHFHHESLEWIIFLQISLPQNTRNLSEQWQIRKMRRNENRARGCETFMRM